MNDLKKTTILISFKIESHVKFGFQDIDHVYLQIYMEYVIFSLALFSYQDDRGWSFKLRGIF